ncbi:MAG: DUF3443 domain-containing protein [Burkholderiales bacterium]|nr:DUF3443 domain-containing protein [Burkholderiales bacterium]
MKNLRLFWLCLLLSGCGGGGGGSSPSVAPAAINSTPTPGTNVIAVYTAQNPTNVNILLASIMICMPNTSNCQVIPNMLVDTGSYGIRLLKSAIPSVALSTEIGAGGGPLSECTQFASGYTWGKVQLADVVMGGETAYGLPIQVIDDVNATPVPALPASCTGKSLGSASAMNANGILGIGVFPYDCGPNCQQANNGIYFECFASGCVSMGEPVSALVKNPVAKLASDNNGIILELPQVPASGVLNVTGSLIFGIGTRSNNAFGATSMIALNGFGNFTTLYKGATLTNSFVDSGSNGLFFPDATIPACTNASYYCPASTQQLTAIMQPSASATSSVTVNFSVGNGTQLLTSNYATFSNLAGNSSDPTSFDWGLPFFFGRNVYFAISGAVTPWGTGPFVAF